MAKRKVDTVLDQELKALMKESDQHVFNEYCQTCCQNKMCCDTCNIIVNGEPVHYLSARDAYEMSEANIFGEYLND